MENTSAGCPCTDEWAELEARYRRAKDAMLQAQQQSCDATYAFLAARAEVRRSLEAIFPEPGSGMQPSVLRQEG